jgi:hypothetical protein
MSKESPHVVQARNELANAQAYGQLDRARAAEKVLAAAGIRRRESAKAKAEDETEVEPRRVAPQGRRARPRETTVRGIQPESVAHKSSSKEV